MVEKIINLMGGEVYFYLNNKRKFKSLEILEFMISETKKLVDKFNFFDENSQISKLNKTKSLEYCKDLDFLLKESIKLLEFTNGKFNIFLGSEIQDRKLNLDINKKNEMAQYNHKYKFQNSILIDISKKEIRILDKNLIIDLGGIAKGYIIDKVLEKTLNKYSKEIIDILIDARGDIISYGKNKKLIEIENPFNKEFSFEEIVLFKASIITSGHNKQQYIGGSHIIGNKSDIFTITLKSKKEHCYKLDALGTYLIQLNSSKVLEKIEFDTYFENIDCLLILNNGKVLKSSFW